MANTRVLLVTEFFAPPYDEGIKRTAFNIYNILTKHGDVLVLCRDYQKEDSIVRVQTNRLFASVFIKKLVKRYDPRAIVYLPFASLTFAGYVRSLILSFYCKNRNFVLIGLQPKFVKNNLIVKAIIRIMKGSALTPSPKLLQYWAKIGVKGNLISLYTNLDQFIQLTDTDNKRKLREKYGIPANKYVLLHIGHLSWGRNLKTLIPLQDDKNQVLIVTSTSTPKDSLAPMSAKSELEDSGILVIDTYVAEVSELYQLSDLYVFPVTDDCSSIGLPLSILEARACGIPVLTTDYGSIKQFLADDHGSVFYSVPGQFKNMLDRIKSLPPQNGKSDVRSLNLIFEKKLLSEVYK